MVHNNIQPMVTCRTIIGSTCRYIFIRLLKKQILLIRHEMFVFCLILSIINVTLSSYCKCRFQVHDKYKSVKFYIWHWPKTFHFHYLINILEDRHSQNHLNFSLHYLIHFRCIETLYLKQYSYKKWYTVH